MCLSRPVTFISLSARKHRRQREELLGMETTSVCPKASSWEEGGRRAGLIRSWDWFGVKSAAGMEVLVVRTGDCVT